jgi:hypothetical protein
MLDVHDRSLMLLLASQLWELPSCTLDLVAGHPGNLAAQEATPDKLPPTIDATLMVAWRLQDNQSGSAAVHSVPQTANTTSSCCACWQAQLSAARCGPRSTAALAVAKASALNDLSRPLHTGQLQAPDGCRHSSRAAAAAAELQW